MDYVSGAGVSRSEYTLDLTITAILNDWPRLVVFNQSLTCFLSLVFGDVLDGVQGFCCSSPSQ